MSSHVLQEKVSVQEANTKIKDAFEKGGEFIFSLSDRTPRGKYLAFDWDGVFTKEIGYYELAWTALMSMMLRGEYSFDIATITDPRFTESDEYKKGKQFRSETRGVEYALRFDALKKMALEAGVPQDSLNKTDEELLALFWEVMFALVNKDFPEGAEGWMYPEARAFIRTLKTTHSEVPAVVVSANVQEALENLITQLSIYDCFDGIFGHPLRSPSEEKRNKAFFLRQLRNKFGLQGDELLFFGDAPSDIAFGREAGVFIVAVSNDYENAQKLLSCEPDVIISSLAPADEIFKSLLDKNS